MRRFLLLSLAAATLGVSAQTPYLVKDLNAARSIGTPSDPAGFFADGNRIYFSAGTAQTGRELWSSDGTSAGTAQVADLFAGTASSDPGNFAIVHGHVVFKAADAHGTELWTTDGTAAGTRLLADINTGSASSSPGVHIVYHDKMIFAAADGVDGRELWITDGTPGGTRFFKDLAPGPSDSSPAGFVLFHDLIYFSANGQLWKSDGTEAGTVVVTPLDSSDLVVAGDRIFCTSYTAENGSEPWVSDGTAAGTHMIADLAPGPASSVYLSRLRPFGDRVLFGASTPLLGAELWISDGSVEGTHVVRELAAGPEGSYAIPTDAVLGDTALFAAMTAEAGMELWKTDGTAEGTVPVRDLNPGRVDGASYDAVTLGGKFYFAGTDGPGTRTLWVTDGTSAGTHAVAQGGNAPAFPAESNPELTVIGGALLFSARNALNGREPWRSDGTAAGTFMLANIAKDAAPSADPTSFYAAGDYLYFFALNGESTVPPSEFAKSFFRTDGTAAGTVLLADTFSFSSLTPVGRTALMTVGDAIWKSDGTAAGTLADPEFAARFPAPPESSFVNGDTIFVQFRRDDAIVLYAAQLSETAPAVDLEVEGAGNLIDFAGRTVFVTQQNGVTQLMISDGTKAGTQRVANLPGGIAYSTPITVMGGQMYFVSASSDYELWKSDGSADGTMFVTRFDRDVTKMVAAGNKLFFVVANDLYVSDGTAAGTRVLPATPVEELTPVGDRVVFGASTTNEGYEPWVSDGTDAGTRMLRDLFPGTYGSSPRSWTATGARAYFVATDDLHFTEIFVTDGTAAGTGIVGDVEPGTRSSAPRDLVAAGDRVFFSAETTGDGRELWAVPLDPRLLIDDIRIAESDSGNTTARFTVRLSPASSAAVTVDYATADGTATAGADYDAKSGTLTFAPGETTKTIDVVVHGDAAAETNETFSVNLTNAHNAAIGDESAFAILEDEDRAADLALSLDLSELGSGRVSVKMTNEGPNVATNIRLTSTVTPGSAAVCDFCPALQLASGATESIPFDTREARQYSATIAALQRDPQGANNTAVWSSHDSLLIESLYATAGSDVKVWLGNDRHLASIQLQSTNPAVLTVPASIAMPADGPGNFLAHGVSAGRATIRALTATNEVIATLDVDVIAPGETPRWRAGVELGGNANTYVTFMEPRVFDFRLTGVAPYTGETPTGEVILTTRGREIGRATLTHDVTHERITFYATEIDQQPIEIHYAGDANFQPSVTDTYITTARGVPAISSTVEVKGTSATVHVRVEGSPVQTPSGMIAVNAFGGIPVANGTLTEVRPGLAEAIITLQDVTPGPHSLAIFYAGDVFYWQTSQSAQIAPERRRSTHH